VLTGFLFLVVLNEFELKRIVRILKNFWYFSIQKSLKNRQIHEKKKQTYLRRQKNKYRQQIETYEIDLGFTCVAVFSCICGNYFHRVMRYSHFEDVILEILKPTCKLFFLDSLQNRIIEVALTCGTVTSPNCSECNASGSCTRCKLGYFLYKQPVSFDPDKGILPDTYACVEW